MPPILPKTEVHPVHTIVGRYTQYIPREAYREGYTYRHHTERHIGRYTTVRRLPRASF